jgi:hypothetical protein
MRLLSAWRAKKRRRKETWSILDELQPEGKPKWWQFRERFRRRMSDP